MKLTVIDIVIIFAYLAATVVIGLVLKKVAQKNKSNYLLGGNKLPWYMLGLSNAYFGHHVVGNPVVCLWLKKYLDTMALACIQPDIFNGFPQYLAAAVECNHRRRMD